MYSTFDRWEEATGAALRIYDPFAYRPALHERIVPVCLSENSHLTEGEPTIMATLSCWCCAARCPIARTTAFASSAAGLA